MSFTGIRIENFGIEEKTAFPLGHSDPNDQCYLFWPSKQTYDSATKHISIINCYYSQVTSY